MFTDGACRGNPGLAGIGVVITTDDGGQLETLKHFVGVLTNNQAEYMALIHGLLWYKTLSLSTDPIVDGLDIYSDSRMMVLQILEQHRVKNPKLAPLYRVVRETLDSLPYSWTISHIPRTENRLADYWAGRSLDPYLNK